MKQKSQTKYVLLSILSLCGIGIFTCLLLLTQIEAAFGDISLASYLAQSLSRGFFDFICLTVFMAAADKLEV